LICFVVVVAVVSGGCAKNQMSVTRPDILLSFVHLWPQIAVDGGNIEFCASALSRVLLLQTWPHQRWI
jgi:hypothetical protein